MSWSSTAPIVLIEETQPFKPMSANPVRRLIQPAGHHDWSSWRQVTFQISIASVDGAPDSWTMTPRLMFGVAHTTGNIYRNPRWYYADATQIARCVVEGTFFPTFTQASNGGVLPYTEERTIRGPLKRLMAIDFGETGSPTPFTMIGGTNPGLRMSLVASPEAVR